MELQQLMHKHKEERKKYKVHRKDSKLVQVFSAPDGTESNDIDEDLKMFMKPVAERSTQEGWVAIIM